jgi:hypothetical protein
MTKKKRKVFKRRGEGLPQLRCHWIQADEHGAEPTHTAATKAPLLYAN